MTKRLNRSNLCFKDVFDGQVMTRGTFNGVARSDELIVMVTVAFTDNRISQIVGTFFDPPFFRLSLCNLTAEGVMCQGKLINADCIPENKSIGNSWDCIESWLSLCESSHKDCQPQRLSSDRSALPARLLYIESGKSVVKVVDTDALPDSNHSYIALSYCWGLEKTLKLEGDTITKLYRGVDVDALPPTYCDAILIASQLDIRYIWIDALCIRQDSNDDWLRESAITHLIFGNARLTISATSNSKVNSALFNSDKSLTRTPPLVELDIGHGLNKYLLDWRTPTTELLFKSPVGDRGWIYAEHLLSRRILHVADEQLFWECNELTANERFPTGGRDLSTYRAGDRTILSTPLKLDDTSLLLQESNHDQELTVLCPGNIWNSILYQYSSRCLTRESDKLPAISGVATRFRERFLPSDKYLAGLWRSDLVLQLLWEVDNSKPATRTKQYQAPSWSPMSLIGRVFNDCPQRREVVMLAEVIDADTTKTGVVDTGPVSDGYVVLQYTLLIKITNSMLTNDNNIAGTNQTANFEEDANWSFGFTSVGASQHDFDDKSGLVSYELNFDTTTATVPTTTITSVGSNPNIAEIYLMPICRSSRQNLDEEDFTYGYEVRGLLISPCSSSSPQGTSPGHSYTRKGVGKLYNEAADMVSNKIREIEDQNGAEKGIREKRLRLV